jgi:non-canonical purine NTP pyrophosphatase (RdgB/HAM1 family)
MPARLVVATKNAGKLAEMREELGSLGFEPESLRDLPFEIEIIEDAATFEGNAVKKARALLHACSCAVLADDSGLEVDALDGGPGVQSARYGGEGLDDAGRTAKLLEALAGVPDERRTARFHCALAFLEPEREPRVFHGVFEGRIGHAPRGSHGFGYDPVFIPKGYDITLAEIPPDEKRRKSHRAQALAAFAAWVRSRKPTR